MAVNCDYCHGACVDGATKCTSCGAPLNALNGPDYRFCPHCKRRLLALGSPACNYCGRNLPESYVKAREAMRQRIEEMSERGAGAGELEALGKDGEDDNLRRALKALFDLDNPSRRKKKK
jgi:DNA-directed RNA polymerase subunit RPC12/RpoP